MKKLLIIILTILTINCANAIMIADQATDLTLTTSSTEVLTYNGVRSYLLIQNKSATDVYLKFDTTITATEGIVIPGGGNYEPYKVPFNSIHLKGSAGGEVVTVVGGH